jgi:hypothetical protein
VQQLGANEGKGMAKRYLVHHESCILSLFSTLEIRIGKWERGKSLKISPCNTSHHAVKLFFTDAE